MRFFKKYKFLKVSCLATFSCGAGWLYYQVRTTRKILDNALDTSILSIGEPTIIEKPENEDFLLIGFNEYDEGPNMSWSSTWKSVKFSFAKRLLALAISKNKFIRKKAVRQLAKIQNLDNWQYTQLSCMIDARTAIGLARTANTDPRFFSKCPAQKYLGHSNDMIVNVMKDLLVNLHNMSRHPCMAYFISKAFLDLDELEYEEFSTFELKSYIQTHEEILPMCLETLLHHASIKRYAKDIAALNGLPLLMEIHKRYHQNINIAATICRIISYLSMHSELLDQIYKSGWVGILAQWVNHDDVRVSIPAAKALANLDPDENPVYLQRLYPLHPSTRFTKEAEVDVVFVHGLLGGVFFTWRQRYRSQNPLGFLGKKGEPESLTQDDEIFSKHCKAQAQKAPSSDPQIRAFIEDMEDHLSSWNSCKEYDVVWEDLPTKTNSDALGPYCCPGYKFVSLDRSCDAKCFTNCWPRDWLAEDCDNLRIIGVNYETNLSLWTPICSVEKVRNLADRSDELIKQLLKVELGKRPIVWVTHSMGGLLVKSLLNKAAESNRKEIRDMYLKTKGVVFYSTPHVGSTVAKFNPASALIIWPSIEVQELQKHSPQLVELHESFLRLVKKRPIKIVSFVETQPTVVSAMKFKFLVVEPDSGNPGCGEYYEIPLDHLGICKPVSRYSFLYQKVLHLIRNIAHESDDEV